MVVRSPEAPCKLQATLGGLGPVEQSWAREAGPPCLGLGQARGITWRQYMEPLTPAYV